MSHQSRNISCDGHTKKFSSLDIKKSPFTKKTIFSMYFINLFEFETEFLISKGEWFLET
jgi:hypothetical protein